MTMKTETMNRKYVRLTAKNDEDVWFKPGTEVFYEDSDFVDRRMTVDEYSELDKGPYRYAVFRGIRVTENPASEGRHLEVGEEHVDGEVCSLDEFDVEFVDDDMIPNFYGDTIHYDQPAKN